MKNASKNDLKIAQKHVDQLHKHPDIMSQTKAQIMLAIKDFEIILKDSTSPKNLRELAERGIIKFRAMLKQIN